MREKLKRTIAYSKNIPKGIVFFLLLTLIAGLAYGGLVVTGGVYGDDPNALYAYQRLGNAGFDAFYGWARPFSTWMHKLVIPLMGIDMGRINLVTIALRVFSCWMLFVFTREISGGDETAGLMAAALALVYPGFAQQAQAVQYLLHFSVLTLALFSLWTMARGVKQTEKWKRVVWMALSILSACAHVSIEYFIGLELLRPIVLGVVSLKKKEQITWKRFMPYYAPFLLLLAGYLTWRVALFQPAYPRITILAALRTAPISTTWEFLQRMGTDLVQVLGGAWVQMIKVISQGEISIKMIVSGMLAGLAGAAGLRAGNPSGGQGKKKSMRVLFIGACALIMGGVPLWASGTPLEVIHPWNRTTLCYLIGVSMVFAGLLRMTPKWVRGAITTMMIGLSVIFQQISEADYAREWELVKGLFRQLTEQAPQLKENTLVLYDDFPLRYYSANNLNAFLNWTYDPEEGAGRERYKMFEIDERLGGTLPALAPGLLVKHNTFEGNTSQVLVIAMDAEGVLTIRDRDSPLPSDLPGRSGEAAHLSAPDAVIIYGEGIARLPDILH